MSSSNSAGTRRKAKSGLFNRSAALTPLSPIHSDSPADPKNPQKSSKKKSAGSRLSTAFMPSADSRQKEGVHGKARAGNPSTPGSSRPVSSAPTASFTDSDSPKSSRPSLGRRARPSSIFGSLKSLRFGDEEETPPPTATSQSSQTPSLTWKEFGGELPDARRSNVMLHHGEAQTSSGWFWKKKEYLVLTESHLMRYKNRAKANEAFPSVPLAPNRQDLLRHSSSRSIDSTLDQHSVVSDMSGDKVSGISLDSVVAVYLSEDVRPMHAVEVSYLDSGQSSSITLQFIDSDDRDLWLRSIREAANRARLLDVDPVAMKLVEYVSRVVEREQDYEPTNIKIYKIVKRAGSKSSGRSSADDSTKAAPVVCFLVIGLNKVHIIPLPKHSLRGSSATLGEHGDGGSFGILTLTWISVSSQDDSFTLAFRFPFQAPRAFSVASLASSEIALQLRQRDNFLRPEWLRRPFGFTVPSSVEDEESLPIPEAENEDLNCFERTLTAFCVAYGVNPNKICYSVNWFAEDSPQFELLSPSYANTQSYTALDLLAIFRSLRYNEYFKSISFASVNLDTLRGQRDYHGMEHLCTHTKSGAAIRIGREEMESASLLVSEIRAIAASSPALRRLNFSYSMLSTNQDTPSRIPAPAASIEVVEALYPLCLDQATNVDWLGLNGLCLAELDLEYLVGIASDRSCHLRAVELSNCGLSDASISLLLNGLKAQSETLEAIDISHNVSRHVPSYFKTLMEPFDYIRKLDLSNMAIASATEPFLPEEVLLKWRLEELKLNSVTLSDRSVQTICRYLCDAKSEPLRELMLNDCALSGRHVWDLMHALKRDPGTARLVHLDISNNNLQEGHDHVVRAIARNLAPTHLTLRSLEYENDNRFAELIFALAQNKSIRYLDLARVSLPGEASPEICTALEELFSSNTTLEDLDISGEISRLEITKFGTGFIRALKGFRHNTTLQILKIQYQKLGLPGASALADVLRENKTLKQLHCEGNGITLSGFTDLVNALAYNRTLLYLPSLEEGRNEALKQTEDQIKIARSRIDGSGTSSPSKLSGVRRTFAKIGSSENSSSSSTTKLGSVPQWSNQDVQAALRLVDEGWEGQMVRLHAFLNRNNKIAEGIPLDEPEELTDEESHQRPGTAASISKILEKVKFETTPTVEKYAELGNDQKSDPSALHSDSPSSAEHLILPRVASPNIQTSSRRLGDVEIDTTPMFERDDPFASGPRDYASRTSIPNDENASTSAPPSDASGGSMMELKLPATKLTRKKTYES